MSSLMASINAVNELREGAVLIVYAVTPDLIERMTTFSALQQRLVPPDPKQHFFAGYTLAPIIDLSLRDNPYQDLRGIGERLVELFFEVYAKEVRLEKAEVLAQIDRLARETVEQNYSAGNRREMVKMTCALLLRLLSDGAFEAAATVVGPVDEDEV